MEYFIIAFIISLPVLIPYCIWMIYTGHKEDQTEFARLLEVSRELGVLQAEYKANQSEDTPAEH